MFRYLIFAWNPQSAAAAAAARHLTAPLATNHNGWTQTLAIGGLIAYHADERPSSSIALMMPNQHGVIFGTVFRRDDEASIAERVQTMSEAQALKAQRTKGSSLFDDYWGRFVAVIRDELSHTTLIARDPTGGLPCFRAMWNDVSVFYSFTPDCPVFSRKPPSINWSYVGAHASSGVLQTHETGLSGVEEILPGETLTLTRDGSSQRQLHWNPVTIAEDALAEPLDRITARLRRTTEHCVWTWSRPYPRIVHLLSGGLDSSIVLTCLRNSPSPSNVHCLNYHYAQCGKSDEREYAASVARKLGCELTEEESDLSMLPIEALLEIDATTKPLPFLYYLDQCRRQAAMAEKVGATALFEGSGGDQIYYQAPIGHGAVDRVHRLGLWASSLRLSYQIAFMQRVSLASVLIPAVKDYLGLTRYSHSEEVGKFRSFVSAEILHATRNNPSYHPPWLATPTTLPRGKLWHILELARWPDFYDPFCESNHPERVHPLVSQPLLELVLRISTDVLVERGWDRAIARRAFVLDLPSELIHRRSKGLIDDAIGDLLVANVDCVRELLLDGYLVRERILDRPKLELRLQHGQVFGPSEAGEIVWDHLCTEAWLRRWIDDRRGP